MSRSLSRFQAAVLGLVVLAGTALGSWGLYEVGRHQRLWAETFDLTAGFRDLAGVGPGTPVRVGGLPAGEVAAVGLPERPGERFRVTLRIDRRYQYLFTQHAAATVRGEGLIGTKSVEVDPGVPPAGEPPLPAGGELAVREAADLAQIVQDSRQLVTSLNAAVARLDQRLDAVLSDTQGLVKDSRQLVQAGYKTLDRVDGKVDGLARDTTEALTAIKADADAVKRLPIVRGYVEDANRLLVRPAHHRFRLTFAADELFEPGRAVLTEDGKVRLAVAAEALNGDWKVKGSDVVVAAFAAPGEGGLGSAAAKTLTEEQARAVVEHLRDAHKVHKLGWWSTRDTTPLGMGHAPPPVPEAEKLPPGRVEVIAFVPAR